MAGDEQEEQLVDSADDPETILDHKRQVNHIKIACVSQFYAMVYQILFFVNAILLQVLTVIVLVLFEALAPTVPTVTFSSLGVEGVDEGIAITRLVMAAVIVMAAARLYKVNRSGFPEVTIEENGDEDD